MMMLCCSVVERNVVRVFFLCLMLTLALSSLSVCHVVTCLWVGPVLRILLVQRHHLCHVESKPSSCVSPLSRRVSCLKTVCCIINVWRPKKTCLLFLFDITVFKCQSPLVVCWLTNWQPGYFIVEEMVKVHSWTAGKEHVWLSCSLSYAVWQTWTGFNSMPAAVHHCQWSETSAAVFCKVGLVIRCRMSAVFHLEEITEKCDVISISL